MIALADVIQRFGTAYLASAQVTAAQRQALAALQRCRTQLASTFTARCSNADCAVQRVVPHSCGHRHCPHCQHSESQRWIERQRGQLVPGPYFLITFTLPAELRPLAWAHQRVVYDALMDCAWHTLREFARNHRHLRGCPGAVAVLHTHNRALGYHPHVHLALPAAALDVQQRLWRTLPREQGYLFNQRALAAVLRGKLLAALKGKGLQPPVVLPERWVAHCKRLDHGAAAMVYLGRYLYRGVIQEKDIVRCDDAGVTWCWREGATGQVRQRTASGVEFLRLVMLHVLPKGLRRARCYGFLHPNARRMAALLKLLVYCMPTQWPRATEERPVWKCSHCGAPMRVILRRGAPLSAAATAPPATRDTGARA